MLFYVSAFHFIGAIFIILGLGLCLELSFAGIASCVKVSEVQSSFQHITDSFDSSSSSDFNSCIEDIDMEDMNSKGFWLTWSNKRGGMGHKKSRIDRVLVNYRWQDCFPESDAVF